MSEHDTPALVTRLERSRTALLEALTERTEADFARPLGSNHGDEPLGRALAALARAERADLATARSEPPPKGKLPERPLPPQVTHDLAGARYQTLTHLAELDHEAATALVSSVVEREGALVSAIGAILGHTAS